MVMDESSGTPHMDNHQDSPPWPQEGVTPSPQNNQILDGVQHDWNEIHHVCVIQFVKF